MNGKRVLVTGATDGIGKVSALELAKMGAEVIIVGRSPQKTERVLNELKIESGHQNLDMLIADLSSTDEIRRLVAEFLSKYDSLDVLLNNAGAIFNEYKQSADGLEMTFALNHVNYFFLTNFLLDTLKKTAQEKGEARIVNVSSGAHMQARNGLTLDNLYDETSFSSFRSYGDSKLANILFTYELAIRLEGTDVSVNALHPGMVATSFGHNTKGVVMPFLVKAMQMVVGKSPEQGAETMIYLSSSPEVKGITGKYWDNKKQVKSSTVSYNRDHQKRLWEVSEEVTGIDQMVKV
jgi:NAD(P)-dependent dehydrogenase (short-subunit alcohol dehydrogenase family)